MANNRKTTTLAAATDQEWLENRALAAPSVMVKDIDKVAIMLIHGGDSKRLSLERAQEIEVVYIKAMGNISDPSAANWKAPEGRQEGMIQTQDFIDKGTRANLNGMEQMLGPQGLNQTLSLLIGAVLTAQNPNPQDHGRAERQAAKTAVDAAYACSQASGKLIKSGDVMELAQQALKSAQAGFDSF